MACFTSTACHPRSLDSFPTRRSSDLPGHVDRDLGLAGAADVTVKLEPQSNSGESGTATLSRSEEHTSELQSLRHLVCRLLLEKKKSTKTVSSCSIPNYLVNESAQTTS